MNVNSPIFVRTSGFKLRQVGLWSTILRIQPILFVTPILWCILLGCQNTGLWMMKWWRSTPKSVWVNNFLFNREHKRDVIQCIWMVAESSPNLSPNPPMGSETESSLMHTLLIGLSQTIRGCPASWDNTPKMFRLTTQTAPYLKPHMETQSEIIRASCCCFSRHSGLPLYSSQRDTGCSLMTQQYSTYKEWV